MPAEKLAAINAQPDAKASEGTDDSGDDAAKPAADDSGPSADVAAVKAAVVANQVRYNKAQTLSPVRATRVRQAQLLDADTDAAIGRGVSSFSSEALAAEAVAASQPGGLRALTPDKLVNNVSGYRIMMARTFDSSVLLQESRDLAKQLVIDAEDEDIPSLYRTSFQVAAWQGVRVDGDYATVLVVGAYTNCFNGGAFTSGQCVTNEPEQWQLALRHTGVGWRFTSRDATVVGDEDFDEEMPATPEEGAAGPGPEEESLPTEIAGGEDGK